MQKLEQQLNDWLVTKAPFQLPENGRHALVRAMPWLTLIGGILMLIAAWGIVQLITFSNPLIDAANQLNAMYGVNSPVASYSPLMWADIAILVIEALLFFIAYPALKTHSKKGWNLLYWITLANAVSGVVRILADGSIGSLIGSLLGTVIGLYLVFQIRAYYTGEKKLTLRPASPTMIVPKETPAAEPKSPTSTDKKA